MGGMADMTRTHWLLVVLLGVVVWFFGWITSTPVLAIPGVVAVIVGVVGAVDARARS